MSNHSSLYAGYENWKGWDALFRYTPDKADYFSGETRGLPIAQADVLEIGFGSGDFLQWAMDNGASAAGTEVNPVLLDEAGGRGIALVDPEFERVADEYAEYFDTIAAFDVFEHFMLEEIVARLDAAEKMLKPGGYLLLRFPNAQSPFGLAPQHGDPTHRTALSRSLFEQLIQGSSLEIVRYGHQFRAKGRSPGVFLVRMVRHLLRDAISLCLNFIYATRIPYDPVAVIVMRKRAEI